MPLNVLQMLASTTKPASGAAIGQVILATVGGLTLSAAVLALVLGHRSGRLQVGDHAPRGQGGGGARTDGGHLRRPEGPGVAHPGEVRQNH